MPRAAVWRAAISARTLSMSRDSGLALIRSSRTAGGMAPGWAVHEYTLAERHDGRDRLDADHGGEFSLGLSVDLGMDDIGVRLCRAIENGRKGTAWSAPGCPEVDQDNRMSRMAGLEVFPSQGHCSHC